MQIIRPNRRSSVRGYALTITLILVGVLLLVFGSIFEWVNSNSIITTRNNQYNMSENAAESAVERVIGQMDRDFVSGAMSNAASYAALPGSIDQTAWPEQYTFSGTNGDTHAGAGTVSVVFAAATGTVQPLDSQYAGLNGMAQSVDVYATATPSSQRYNVPALVHESLQYANIPLFQFAIFYNVNLEIDPGATMTITGPVFCNQNIWEGSSVCTFLSSVSAVGTNYSQVANPFADNYSGSGAATFSGGAPINNAHSLVMPMGTNNSPGAILGLLNLPPATYAMGSTAAYSSNGIAYPANAADLVLTNFVSGTNFGTVTPTGTNMIVYYQDGGLAQVPYDFYTLKTGGTTNSVVASTSAGKDCVTNVLYAGFTWATNVTFGDWREGWGSSSGKKVQAVQIDMGLLNKWLTNTTVVNSGYTDDQTKLGHSNHHIGSLYVYTGVPLSGTQLPAVRVTDGAALPNPGGSTYGFTVATPFPLYVWKDYNSQNSSGTASGTNTLHTVPAALMGDSITVLSDSWSDTNITKLPPPSSTTVNAAMLEGIVQTNPNINGNYSGGVENFMRLLENWSTSTPLTYNGSIVVLFYSQYATNTWLNTGNYYNPPKRNWAFDLNFKSVSKLPPLTPDSRAMIRGNWYVHQ